MRTVEFERIQRDTVPCEDDPTWFHHPVLNNVLLREKGNTFKLLVDGAWKINEPKEGNRYLYVCFNGKEIPLHILKLETFIVRPELKGRNKLLGNHIDGNIFNNDIENLEWVTYRGNLIHAYQTGLRNDNKIIELIDLQTSEEKSFFSLNECARHLKVNPSKITQYLKKKRGHPFLWKYNFRVNGALQNKLGKEHVCTASKNHPKPFIMINEETGDEVVLGLYSTLMKNWGVTERQLKKVVSGELKVRGVWKYKEIDDPDELRTLCETLPDVVASFNHPKKLSNMRSKKSKEVLVTGIDGPKKYPSLKDFCKENNFNFSALQKYIYLNPGKSWNGYVVTYV